MTEETNGQVEAIERLVRTAIESGTPTDRKFVIIPQGYQLHDLEKQLEMPYRVKGSPSFATVQSFIEYVNAWKITNVSTIFCDIEKRSLSAQIDDHANHENPSWRTHQATFTANLSRELKFWMGQDKKDLTQVQFAELLEERLIDVETPPGATLLELALNLQTKTDVTFRSAVRLNTGTFRMEYAEEAGNGNVDLPAQIGLGIPFFQNGDPYKLLARLRFRVKDGKATFRYQLVDIEDKLERAFKKIVDDVAAAVADVPIYQGTR